MLKVSVAVVGFAVSSLALAGTAVPAPVGAPTMGGLALAALAVAVGIYGAKRINRKK